MGFKNYLSLIKFSHTIFALPFAMLGFFLALLHYGKGMDVQLLVLVLLAMVFARSAAMAFNRYLDRDIDAQNDRTKTREIPAGVIAPKAALLYVILNSIGFVIVAFLINPLCFVLSPIALLVILGYSYTKRFTALCHFVLGLGLALAPIGAYLAAGGGFDLIPLMYSMAVLCWVAGFDIIYALQDDNFDKSLQLHSVPVMFGRKNALLISSILHLICALLIIGTSILLNSNYAEFNWLNWLATGLFLFLLTYQHTLVKPNDLSKVNLAFFTTNGLASLVFGTLLILDIYL